MVNAQNREAEPCGGIVLHGQGTLQRFRGFRVFALTLLENPKIERRAGVGGNSHGCPIDEIFSPFQIAPAHEHVRQIEQSVRVIGVGLHLLHQIDHRCLFRIVLHGFGHGVQALFRHAAFPPGVGCGTG